MTPEWWLVAYGLVVLVAWIGLAAMLAWAWARLLGEHHRRPWQE